jgi:hypothetical protein
MIKPKLAALGASSMEGFLAGFRTLFALIPQHSVNPLRTFSPRALALLRRSLGMGLLLFAGTSAYSQSSITFIQSNSAVPHPSATTVTIPYTSAQGAGNLNVVVVGWNNSTAQVTSVSDSMSNSYAVAVGPTIQTGLATQTIYYAKNILPAASNGNVVTVRFTAAATSPDIRIAEYKGLDTVNPLDVAVAAQGNNALSNSGTVTTTNANDLLVGANLVQTLTTGPGTGFTNRMITSPDGDILEDRVVTATGSYSATAPDSPSGAWIMQMVAFRAASGGGGTAAGITATAGTPQSATVGTAFATQLQATVKDSLNNPVSNVSVTFGAPGSGASGTFAGGVNTATTNAQGVATSAIFTANSAAGGPYTVAATVVGVATPANFSLTNLAGPAASITPTAGTPQSVAINTAFATQLQATVKDSFSNAVSGVTVTFGAPGSGASGTFAGGVNTATTNAQGVAIAPVFTANSIAGGPYTVTATVGGVAAPANFSLTNLAAPPASITATAGTPQSATVGTAFTTQLQATVKDSLNNPVSNVAVTFVAPGSGPSGTFAGGVNTATTNTQGVATAAIFTASSTAGGPYTVAAAVAGVAAPANFSLTNLAGPAASITPTAGTPQSVAINTAFATQLQATVKDSFNNAVSGVTVTFGAPGSGASGTFAGGVNTAVTNPQGIATAPVFTANSTAGGPYIVAAAVAGVATPANFSLTNLAAAPASITATAGTPQSATVGTAFASLQAIVNDASNNPVSNVTVTFAAPGSGASGTFAGGIKTATTNTQGVATAAIFTANSTAGGPYNVTATVAGVAAPGNFSMTNLAGPPAGITPTAGTPQSVAINTAFATQLQATVKDSLNNPVSNVTVTFGAPGSGASGTFAGGVNTATTNTQGVAIAAIFTANSTVGGPYTVAATVAGVATPANFLLTNLAGPPTTITATAGTPQSATVGTAFGTQLQATVKDSLNNPVSNVTVTFGAPGSGASGTFAGGVNTATTNAQGIATAPIFTANAIAGGPYTVTATVPGVATPANFLLTNLPSAGGNITLVQHKGTDAGTTSSSSLAFTSSNTAGNWIAVMIRGGKTGQVFTVSDSRANTYRRAVQFSETVDGTTLGIFYAENIAGGANTVTVSDTILGTLRFAILEYSGIALANSLETTTTNQGTGSSLNSGNATTLSNGDLLLASMSSANAANFTAGSGYLTEESVPAEPNTKLIVEDRIQSSAGTTSAGATLGSSDNWGAALAAFKAAGGGGGTSPNITGLNPSSGAVGAVVTITGTNFGGTQGSSTVTFAGTSAGFATIWSATSITIQVPAIALGSASVVVSVGGVASNSMTFTVIPPPNITGLSPSSGPFGTSVTVTGTNFGALQGSNSVTFNGVPGVPTSWNATTIIVPVPNGATTGNVLVIVNSVASNGMPFSVTSPGPSLSTLSTTQGPVGALVTITGTNFGSTQGSSTVTFGATSAGAASNWSATSIDVLVPAIALGSVNVVVTVAGTPSNALPFTVTPPPSISGISPTAGPIGTVVTINGANFGPTVGTRTSTVSFNGIVARTNSWSDTQILAPVPLGATSGNVVVSIGGITSNGVNFTVATVPNISNVNPTSGPVGTSIVITGTNFGSIQGTVTFNNIAATPTNWTDTSITAPVPPGASTGNVVVTAGGQASNGVNFTVTSTGAPIAFIQSNYAVPHPNASTVSIPYSAAQNAGDLNVVVVGWNDSVAQVTSVADSSGNNYILAVGPTVQVGVATQSIYYARSIASAAANANVVTVTFNTAANAPDIRIAEYSHVDPVNALDASAAAQGIGTLASSGNLSTSVANDLIVGANVVASLTTGPGAGFTSRVITSPDGDILEDGLAATPGSYSATAPDSPSGSWIMQAVAFRVTGGIAPPISVSVAPPTANVTSGGTSQGFTATLQNDTQNKGVTWSLSGSGCTGNACGTLSAITATTVSYSGPPSLPSPPTVTLTATSVTDNSKSATATITVLQGSLSVAVAPALAAVTLTQPQQFTATVFNDLQNQGVTWMVDGNNGGNSTSGTVSTTGLFTPGTQAGQHTVTAASVANASVNASAIIAVTDLSGVLTQHNDAARTGQNLKEYALSPSTVSQSKFGRLYSCPVDGYVYAQPLYVANLTVASTTRNVIFLATEHDSVYAFDADSPSCTQLWKTSFLASGVNTMSWQDTSAGTSSGPTDDIYPEIGITSTPAIDTATNTIYVEAKTKETVGTGCSMSSPCYVNRLHALDILTGSEKFGGPVVISAPNFVSLRHFNRPGLLLANNTLYIGFGSHGDISPWYGWLFGYNPATLAQKFVFSTSDPTGGSNGASLWNSGAGPATDAAGNVYVATGNGAYDGTKNFSESALKISPTGSLVDWFTPFNRATLDANDIDLGSAGVLILPDSVGSAAHPHLALATGKIAILYLLDQTSMGRLHSGSNLDVQEVIPVPPPNTTQLDGGNYGLPAYWNGNIYSTGQNYPLSQFKISNGNISAPQFAVSSNRFPARGATPTVSASGATNGIVWVLDLSGWTSGGNAILDAYDAGNVANLLFTSPVSGPGAAGPAVKFTVPTIANGKVYVPGQGVFTVFGLLP